MSRIFSLISVFFCLLTPLAFAEDSNIYSIQNIPINVAEESPVKARNLAVSTAHRMAFLTLLSRLEIDAKVSDLVTDEELSDMVRSQHIGDEVMSGNNYSALFNITFGRDFVKYALAQKNLEQDGAAVEEIEEKYLLIPVRIQENKALLWEVTNDWRRALEKHLMNNPQEKMILADNDIENITTVNRSNVLNIGYSRLEPMLTRYKANGAYLLFFSNDELSGKAKVEISYIAKMQTKKMKLSFVNVKKIDYDSLLSIIAKKTAGYLAELEIAEITEIGKNELIFEAKIRNLGDWLTVKSRVENSGLINEFNIKSISRDKARFRVNYSGDALNVIPSFAAANVTLEQQGENFYTVKAN